MEIPKIVLVGYGNVGREFLRVFFQQRSFFTKSLGVSPMLVGVITRTKGGLYNPEGLQERHVQQWHLSKTYTPQDGEQIFADQPTEELLQKLDYHVLVECTRNDYERGEPGATYIREALMRGIHVTTTNRGAVAYHYGKLRELEVKYGGSLFFEGTVLSGVPLFSLCRDCLQGSSILSFEGTLSGTCNSILRGIAQGASFDEALREAQRKGYAEPDPTVDVEGIESALKGMIVGQELMVGKGEGPTQISVEGIRHITPSLVESARRKGSSLVLMTRVLPVKAGYSVVVAPETIPREHPLGAMEGITCGALVTTNLHGELAFTGAGAGGAPTAAAIINDLFTIVAKKICMRSSGRRGSRV